MHPRVEPHGGVSLGVRVVHGTPRARTHYVVRLGYQRQQLGDCVQHSVFTLARVEDLIHGVVMTAEVQHQHAGHLIRPLRHVGKMVAVVPGEGVAEDHQIEALTHERSLDLFAAGGWRHRIAGFRQARCFSGEDFRIVFPVENLCIVGLAHGLTVAMSGGGIQVTEGQRRASTDSTP